MAGKACSSVDLSILNRAEIIDGTKSRPTSYTNLFVSLSVYGYLQIEHFTIWVCVMLFDVFHSKLTFGESHLFCG